MHRNASKHLLTILFSLLFFLVGCSKAEMSVAEESITIPLQHIEQPVSKAPETIYVTLGYIDDFFSNTTAHINNFNYQHTEIQIEPIKYDSFEDLSFDIIAGKIPDLICTESDIDNMRLYAAKGVLLPLTVYVDQLNAQNRYFDNVLRTEQTNNEIFFITPSFTLSGFAIPTKLLTNGAKIQTLEELDSLFSADDASIYGHMRKTDMLHNLLTDGLPLFVDYENKTANFQSETFCNILQYCSRFLGENDPPSTETFPLFRFISINSPNQLRQYASTHRKLTPYGPEISYLPMPFSTHNGMAIKGQMYLGISSQTMNIDACYQILNYFFSESVQTQISSQMPEALPVLRTAIPKCAVDTTEAFNIDFDQILLDLIENADHHAGSYHAAIQKIIADEAEYYLSGAKSLEDTVALIQNRAELYLAELN